MYARLSVQMRFALVLGLLLCGVAPAFSQLVAVGVKAGVPLTDALSTINNGFGTATTSTGRWLIGPTAEVHLPFRLSFEVDALYRQESYTVGTTSSASIPAGSQLTSTFSSGPNLFSSTHYSVGDWQIPFLGKYELHGGLLRPFVDAGVTYRHVSGSSYFLQPNSAGFTIGGGLTVKFLFLRLSPELRYTRWGNKQANNGELVTGSGNQADFLVGFTF